MANMLIRTRRESCKYRLALVVRVVLFFAIPTVYLLSAAGETGRDIEDLQLSAGNIDFIAKL